MPRTSNAPVVRPESVVELVAQLHTVIHHDLQGHPCPVEDQFTGSSGNPGFTNSTKTTWCWPTAREVAISHTRLMDCIPFPSSWISAWKLAISPPVTLVIYAPVNAAAAAGLVVDPQLAAGVPQPPAGWVAAAVLPGCKWCKGKRQANNEKHHFGSTLALQREGMVEALEVLQRAEGRAPWWAVTARWYPGQGAAPGVLALQVLPSSMVRLDGGHGDGNNGGDGDEGAEEEGEAAADGAAEEGGGAPPHGQSEGAASAAGDNGGDGADVEQLPPELREEEEGAASKRQRVANSPPHMQPPAATGGGAAGPSTAAGARGAGAQRVAGDGGWDATGLLPPVSDWRPVQAAVAQLLVKMQGHARTTSDTSTPHLLSVSDILQLAARLLDPSPAAQHTFMVIHYRQLRMAAHHPAHLVALLRVLAAQTAADHPLLQEAPATHLAGLGNDPSLVDVSAALQLLPAEPGGYEAEQEAILNLLEERLVPVSPFAASSAALAAACLPPQSFGHVVYPLMRAAAASGGTLAAVRVLHMACLAETRQPTTP